MANTWRRALALADAEAHRPQLLEVQPRQVRRVYVLVDELARVPVCESAARRARSCGRVHLSRACACVSARGVARRGRTSQGRHRSQRARAPCGSRRRPLGGPLAALERSDACAHTIIRELVHADATAAVRCGRARVHERLLSHALRMHFSHTSLLCVCARLSVSVCACVCQCGCVPVCACVRECELVGACGCDGATTAPVRVGSRALRNLNFALGIAHTLCVVCACAKRGARTTRATCAWRGAQPQVECYDEGWHCDDEDVVQLALERRKVVHVVMAVHDAPLTNLLFALRGRSAKERKREHTRVGDTTPHAARTKWGALVCGHARYQPKDSPPLRRDWTRAGV